MLIHLKRIECCTKFTNLDYSIPWCCTLQEDLKKSKRQKKKAPAVEEVPSAEVETRIEYIYEDTQCVTGVEPEYKWGAVYGMISRREV